MRREQSKKFARFICESLTHALLTNNQGVVVGESPAINIVRSRFDRVAERIVRGLFYLETGSRLPTEYAVDVRFDQTGFPSVLPALMRKLHLFSESRVVGDGAFGYRFGKAAEDERSTIWLLLFYECVPMIVFTRKLS